ncbi:MAG TPA: SpoIIE family protein phosphatase [Kofleriaceae bacterium]|nr:SpoIIE family protein phosphatase [Kofleriaceae bacterium]
MAAVRPPRAGIPISVKLIVTTSIVVAAAVGTATWFANRAITEVTDDQIAARRASGEAAITRESELVVQAVTTAVALPLGGNNYTDIKPVLDAALERDKKSHDNRVRWLVVLDDNYATVNKTQAAPEQATLDSYGAKLKQAGIVGNGVVRARIGETDWVYGADITLGTATVGKLEMGVSTAGLEGELTRSIEQATEVSKAARNRALLVSLLVLALGIGFAALQGSRLARPIKALTRQAERIASGDLNSRVEENRGDELGTLARTFNIMSDEIRDLLVEQAQKASLEKEMSLARQVQQAMLPPSTLDQHGALKVVGYCMPASSCGGDWWTYRKLPGGRMLLVVGDATGHGLHSAMVAATARGAVEALSAIDERLLTPEQVLRAIDSGIRQLGESNVLMTAFAALFDANTAVLHYANAGQNFPYVVGLGAERVLGQPSIIAASGNPLGDRSIAVEIRRGSLQLHPGDLFVCFTDGLVERSNPAGKLFGDRRLRKILVGAPLTDGQALVSLRDRVVHVVEQYAEGAIAEDDVTLVLCQFDPVQAPSRLSTTRGVA